MKETYMKFGILGSGMVAQQLGLGLIKSGHDVKLGTRDISKLAEWQAQVGAKGSVGTFEDAAKFGEIIFLSTHWADGATQNAINLAGKVNFDGKIVADTTNPLVFDKAGAPPKLDLGFPDSAGAAIQRWLPNAKVVKAFNIITAYYMANPNLKEGKADMFFAGDDPKAKQKITAIAEAWGWRVIDIGDIKQAYLLEAMALVWIRYGFMHQHWKHAFKLLNE
jgi:8-hydroxy-5-deazaflavin:NADPH oxidoreductase